MTINKKNFRSTLGALVFGALVTVLPASADTISLAVTGSPTQILVGGVSWTFAGGTIATTTVPTGGLALDGGLLTSEIANFNGANIVGTAAAPATQSEVIDVTVKPTVNGGATAATNVTFQGILTDVNGTYSLYFGGNGTTGCTSVGSSSCFGTANGNVVNNGQTVVSTALGNYTMIQSNGIDYEVQTSTNLGPTKSLNYLNGFVGVVGAPEPATYATTGLAAAFLGLFLRRKAKKG